jgi:hypothetical protein
MAAYETGERTTSFLNDITSFKSGISSFV